MNIATKTKPAIHLTSADKLVLTNPTSGIQKVYGVIKSDLSEDVSHAHPVRVTLATPEPLDKKSSAVVGYNLRDNVDVVA